MTEVNTFLVDDDFIFRTAATMLLKSNGFTGAINTYQNGLEALDRVTEIIESDPDGLPHLLLLDINMPVMNGWEFLESCVNSI